MRRSPLCFDLDVYAGNRVRIYVEAFAPVGSAVSVNPSTARLAITDINGTTVSLSETVTYAPGNGSVRIESFWDIPDDQRGGTYTVTIETAGTLVGATERYIKVRSRVLPTVPV